MVDMVATGSPAGNIDSILEEANDMMMVIQQRQQQQLQQEAVVSVVEGGSGGQLTGTTQNGYKRRKQTKPSRASLQPHPMPTSASSYYQASSNGTANGDLVLDLSKTVTSNDNTDDDDMRLTNATDKPSNVLDLCVRPSTEVLPAAEDAHLFGTQITTNHATAGNQNVASRSGTSQRPKAPRRKTPQLSAVAVPSSIPATQQQHLRSRGGTGHKRAANASSTSAANAPLPAAATANVLSALGLRDSNSAATASSLLLSSFGPLASILPADSLMAKLMQQAYLQQLGSASDRTPDVQQRAEDQESNGVDGSASGAASPETTMHHGPPAAGESLMNSTALLAGGTLAFDAAAALDSSKMFRNSHVRMADRVECDICHKQVCNKYFLKSHKFKVHGIVPTTPLPAGHQTAAPIGDSPVGAAVTPLIGIDQQALSLQSTAGSSNGRNNKEDETILHAPLISDGAGKRAPSSSSSLLMEQQAKALLQALPSLLGANALSSSSSSTTSRQPSTVAALPIITAGMLPLDSGVPLNMAISAAGGAHHHPPFDLPIDLRPPSNHQRHQQSANQQQITAQASPLNLSMMSHQPSSSSSSSTTLIMSTTTGLGMPPGTAAGSIPVGAPWRPSNATWRWKEASSISRVTCDICGKELCNKYFLRTHRANRHGIKDDRVLPPSKKPTGATDAAAASAASDGEAGTETQKSLTQDDLGNRCSECDKYFGNPAVYRRHMLLCHDIKVLSRLGTHAIRSRHYKQQLKSHVTRQRRLHHHLQASGQGNMHTVSLSKFRVIQVNGNAVDSFDWPSQFAIYSKSSTANTLATFPPSDAAQLTQITLLLERLPPSQPPSLFSDPPTYPTASTGLQGDSNYATSADLMTASDIDVLQPFVEHSSSDQDQEEEDNDAAALLKEEELLQTTVEQVKPEPHEAPLMLLDSVSMENNKIHCSAAIGTPLETNDPLAADNVATYSSPAMFTTSTAVPSSL